MMPYDSTQGEHRSTQAHVVILTALDVEYRAVRAHLTDLRTIEGPTGSRYEVGSFTGRSGPRTVAIQCTGPGNPRAAVEAERAIPQFRPEMVLFVGVAGGRKDVALGDVVAADEIYDYETGKDTGRHFLPRFKTHQSSHRLVQAARHVASLASWRARADPDTSLTNGSPRAFVGPLAAGGRVIAHRNSDAAVRLARNAGDALAVEMEGYGFLAGAHVNQHVDALVVRGISDLLGDKVKSGHDARWQPVAAASAAAFAYEVISETGLGSRQEPRREDGEAGSIRSPEAWKSGNGASNGLAVELPGAGAVRPPDTVEGQGRVSVAPPAGRRDGPIRGRRDLVESVTSSPGASVHVLAGLGGSGKSRVALEVAHRMQRAGWKVWWVSVPLLNAAMCEVANQLGASESRVERAWRGAGSATDLVWHLLEAESRPWLLVFDNADDPQRLAPLDGLVSDGSGWLRRPESSRGKVVVTSRDGQQATWGRWSKVHSVLPLPPSDGADMLLDRMRTGGSHDDARRLSAQLGGLPLALRGAADYLKTVTGAKISLAGPRIRDFESYRAALKQSFDSLPGQYGHGLNESLGLELVERVFSLSLDLLARRGHTQAAPLLRAFACLNIAPIPHRILMRSEALSDSPLFAEFTEQKRFDVLNALADLGFIEPDTSRGNGGDSDLASVLTLHPLVHGILRKDEEVQRRRADFYGLNVRMLSSATRGRDPDLPDSWDVWDLIAPHAIEVLRAAVVPLHEGGHHSTRDSALELARLTSRFLIEAGLLKPAQDLLRPLIEECESFGLHRSTAQILALRHEKGRLAIARGDPQTAEAELHEVITERAEVLGDEDGDTLASRHKLAKAVLEQGRWEEAERLLSSVVRSEYNTRGAEHPDTLVVRHSLARSILNQGRYAEAANMVSDILRVRRSVDTETLNARQTRARCLFRMKKYGEAERELREALNDCRGHWDSPAAMWLRHILMEVFLVKGQVVETVAGLRALHRDRCRVLGESHPDTERTRGFLTKTVEGFTGSPDHDERT